MSSENKAPDESPNKTATRAAIAELQEKLGRQERTTGPSGALDRLPKGRQFNIKKLAESDPEHHYRFVNVNDPAKVEGRIEQGYVEVPEADCTKVGVRARVGADLRLMKCPRDKYEERITELKNVNKSRLKAHKKEVREVAEAVVAELRARGVDVDLSRILVDE